MSNNVTVLAADGTTQKVYKTTETSGVNVGHVNVDNCALPAGAALDASVVATNTALGLLAKVTDTQPVSAASLPLPTGAATSEAQTTTNTALTTINTSVSAVTAAVAAKVDLSTATNSALLTVATAIVDGATVTLDSTKQKNYLFFINATGSANCTVEIQTQDVAGNWIPIHIETFTSARIALPISLSNTPLANVRACVTAYVGGSITASVRAN